jgi:putative tryptophan/tyrosine transport system substrate-binding protein
MISRRRLLIVSGVSVAAAPLAATAQPAGRRWRIGTLHTTSPSAVIEQVTALQLGLTGLGYVPERQLTFITRNVGVEMTRLPQLAEELVRERVDVIVTSTNPATLAAKKATRAIPIVMTTAVDPVTAGIVSSLARPGANVTGLTFDVDARQLAAKRLEILKELVPALAVVAILWNPDYTPGVTRVKGTEEAAHQLGVRTLSAPVSRESDLGRTFAEIRKGRADAITVLSDPLVVTRRAEVVAIVARTKIPAIYALREFVEDGGLISYATSLVDQWRRAARYVDKVLHRVPPGELPIEQPTAFELWINLKTAKALGLAVPRALLLRADRIIE